MTQRVDEIIVNLQVKCLGLKVNDKQLDPVFEALSNKHRRGIIYTLGFQPASISQLAEQQKLSLPAIHKHIKVLEEAKLIRRKKHGRVNFLALNKDQLVDIQKWLMQFNAHWGNRTETLENYVSSIKKAESKLSNQ